MIHETLNGGLTSFRIALKLRHKIQPKHDIYQGFIYPERVYYKGNFNGF